MPKEQVDKLTSKILEEMRQRFPDMGFIIVALEKSKHPDNGDPTTDIGMATNLRGRDEVLYWLSDIVTNVSIGFGASYKRVKPK